MNLKRGPSVVGTASAHGAYLLFADKTKNGVHCDRYLCNNIKKAIKKLNQKVTFLFL